MITSIIGSFIISLLALMINCRDRYILFSVPFIIVVFLFGFRVGFGADYWNYLEFIISYYENKVFINSHFGFAFEYVVKISYYLGLPPEFTLFVFFLVTYYFFVRSIWLVSPYYFISLLILFCAGPLFPSLNLVRQSLAFSIVLYAFVRMNKIGTIWYFLVTLLVCFTVHFSVFVLLLIPLFSRFSNRLLFWFLAFICVLSLKTWIPQIVDVLVDYYSNTELLYSNYFVDTRYLFTDRTNTGALLYGNVLIAGWVAYKLTSISSNYRHSSLCKTYIVGVLMVLLFSEFQAFVRLFQNYVWLGFLVLPIALSYYKDPLLRIVSIYGLVIYSIILGLMLLIGLNEEFSGGSHLLLSN